MMDDDMKDIGMDGLRISPLDGERASDAMIEQMAASLKVTMRVDNFMHLVSVVKFLGFLRVLEVCNGPLKPCMRPAAELRWANFLKEECNSWHGHHTSEETKLRQLDKGLAQCNEVEAEEFWKQKANEEMNRISRAAIRGHNVDAAADETTLKTPLSATFTKLVRMTFKGFLTHTTAMNRAELVTRSAVEAAWKEQVRRLFLEENPGVDYESRGEANITLHRALNQIHGVGKYKPNKYWASNDPNSLRSSEVIEKAAAMAVRRASKKSHDTPKGSKGTSGSGVQIPKAPRDSRGANAQVHDAPKGSRGPTRIEKPKSKRKTAKEDKASRTYNTKSMTALETMVAKMGLDGPN